MAALTAIAHPSVAHPSWCARTERAGEDHKSVVLHAAGPTDCTDIRLHLQTIRVDDNKAIPLIFADFVEDEERDERYLCLLSLEQAQLLVSTLNQLIAGHRDGLVWVGARR